MSLGAESRGGAEPSGALRIADTLRRRRRQGTVPLIAYVMYGDPDPRRWMAAALGALDGGAAVLELGLPFSDPLADGPVIQAAGQRALAAGARPSRVFEALRELLRSRPGAVVCLMSYFNPVLAYGPERWLEQAAEAGAAGVILPDLPPEEAGELPARARQLGLAWIPFVAPTGTEARLRAALSAGTGFVYGVALTGVTGSSAGVDPRVPALVGRIRALSPWPVAVGFGISTAADLRSVGQVADAVVVGSALVRRVAEGGSSTEIGERVRREVVRLLGAS
ncbi:MAG: tryptophan synthase subunit alpha [Bacillota bacterium]|nr:tryptophan synthase subunit alpha [Bacillota bacterium]